MPSIDLPGTPALSMAIKTLDATTLAERYKSSIALFAARSKVWAGVSWDQQVATWGGVKVKLHVDPNDTLGTAKKEQLKPALELVASQSGLPLLPDMEVYLHGIDQACLGYLLPFGSKLKAVLILAKGVRETKQKLVSHAIRESYGGEGNPVAEAMQLRAAVLHELGHVYHQLVNPSHYFAIGQLTILSAKTPGELGPGGAYAAKYGALFDEAPNPTKMSSVATRIRTLGRNVSEYAAAGTSHPNELVAEVFSGLMLGQTFDDDVMAAYRSMGGPTVSEGDTFRTRRRRGAIVVRAEATASSADAPVPDDIGSGL